ncbi:MAG: hypothetical protein WBL85_00180, partial [Sedimentisphaerales bacterium]
MKTHPKINTVILAVTVLVLLPSTLAFADNIYVSSYNPEFLYFYGPGNIYKFDSSGTRTTFASGLH